MACRVHVPKARLLRFVRQDGGVTVDTTGKAQSRGAYLCRSLACCQRAQKTRQLERVFRTQLPPEFWPDIIPILLTATKP